MLLARPKADGEVSGCGCGGGLDRRGERNNTTQLAADSGKKLRGMNSIFNKIHWGRMTSEVETRQATDSGDPTYIVIGISLNSSSTSTSSSSSSINQQAKQQ